MQKYRLYLKRVSGVSPTQGRRGLGNQPEWPSMMGPSSGMGMATAQSPMGPFVPVSAATRAATYPALYGKQPERPAMMGASFGNGMATVPSPTGPSCCTCCDISCNIIIAKYMLTSEDL